MKYSKTIQSISLASIMTIAGSTAGAMELSLSDVDLNADGKVTEEEIVNVIRTHFFSMDKDANSVISGQEWLEHENSER